MNVLEDLTLSELPLALGIGAGALVLAALVPGLRPQIKSAVKIGLDLFGESEAEAEASVIDRLARPAVAALMDALSKPPGDPAAHQEIDRTLQHFRRRAEVHAQRWARNPAHIDRHYGRHVRRLRRHLDHAWQRHRGGDPQRYQRLIARVDGELGVAGADGGAV